MHDRAPPIPAHAGVGGASPFLRGECLSRMYGPAGASGRRGINAVKWIDVRRRLGLVYALVMAVLVFVAAGVQQVIERELWVPPGWLAIGPFVVIGLDTLQRNVRDAWRRRHRPRVGEALGNIRRAAETAMVRVSEITEDLPVQRMGVNVFVVRKTRWRRRPYLHRLVRSRIGLGVTRSDVVFTEGKGVIGRCWDEKRAAYCHWQPIYKRYADRTLDEAAWAKVPDKHRWGFSREDFLAMVDKYAEVRAVPLTSERGGTFLGCVALDREVGSDSRQLLNSSAVLKILTEAAGVIGPEVDGL